MKRFALGLAFALATAGPVLAVPFGSTVNITVSSSVTLVVPIYTVDILGFGGDVDAAFTDPFAAPDFFAPEGALEAARIALGLPVGTVFGNLSFVELAPEISGSQTFTSNYNPTDNPDFLTGDPLDFFTWIAIGPEDVNIFVSQEETFIQPYALTASVIPPSPVPLPAAAGLLAGGLAALAALGAWRRSGLSVG